MSSRANLYDRSHADTDAHGHSYLKYTSEPYPPGRRQRTQNRTRMTPVTHPPTPTVTDALLASLPVSHEAGRRRRLVSDSGPPHALSASHVEASLSYLRQ